MEATKSPILFLLLLLLVLTHNALLAGEIESDTVASKTPSGYHGMVMVFETTLFQAKNIHSKIVERIRKGKIIYIHPRHFLLKNVQEDTFYATVDSLGRDAYVLKDHIRLITDDARELDFPINVYDHQIDPTDYRIEEPLDPNYPFYQQTQYNLFLSFSLQNSSYEPYQYPHPIIRQDHSTPYEIGIGGLKTPNRYLMQGRLQLGGVLWLQKKSVEYSLAGNISAKEKFWQLGFGPWLSFKIWEKKRHQWNLFIAPIFYIHNSLTINQYAINNGHSSEKSFKGQHFTLRLGNHYLYQKIIPNIDLLLGLYSDITPPYLLKAKSHSSDQAFWGTTPRHTLYRKFDTSIGIFAALKSL
ncbi:MAG: hypothetical protein HQK50_02415 [Oligoflexia bacterium]|nr:hypothetical protein [Oligoflexia bacterium]